MNLINEEEGVENNPNSIIIEDCKVIKGEMDAIINHVLREASRCADVLARMGREQNEQEVRMLVPPNEIIEEM